MENIPDRFDGGVNKCLEGTVVGLEQCSKYLQTATSNEHVQHERIAIANLHADINR